MTTRTTSRHGSNRFREVAATLGEIGSLSQAPNKACVWCESLPYDLRTSHGVPPEENVSRLAMQQETPWTPSLQFADTPVDEEKMMPRHYLTWSQLNLFERDPAAYRRQYILGEPFVTNEYIEFGKRFAQELEHRKGTLWEYAKLWFPDYPRREYGISAPCDVCPLYAKYDAFDPKQGKIGEYKTGKKWDQRRVDEDSQLTFYAFVYWEGIAKLSPYPLPTQQRL